MTSLIDNIKSMFDGIIDDLIESCDLMGNRSGFIDVSDCDNSNHMVDVYRHVLPVTS